jgi:hypothetical protein
VESASIVVAFLGIVTTGFLGVVAYRLSASGQAYVARRSIGDLHSEMARMRTEYPAVRTMCRRWSADDSLAMYDDDDPSLQALRVRYEAYIDIGLEFCNSTLGAGSRGLLHELDFERQYRPLVHLFLAENWPFVEHVLLGPYLSGFIRDEVRRMQGSGHDWRAAHRAVTGSRPAD